MSSIHFPQTRKTRPHPVMETAVHSPSPRHRAPDHRARRVWRRIRNRGVAMLAAGTLVGVGLPATAAADPAPNPYVNATVEKLWDGTGHDSKATSTFIRSENGFAPADDTETDGVVASGDTVAYRVVLAFRAAAERQVRVHLDIPDHLKWEAGKDGFAANGTVVKATRVGDDVVFDVGAGKVDTLSRVLVLTAKDTGGRAVPDQQLALDVSIDGKASYSRAAAGAVTVVSVPRADLIICPRGVSRAADGVHTCSGDNVYDGRGAGTGTFTIAPNPLKMPGYSTKGISTSGQWRGSVDVSSFPAGTSWRFDGKAVTPVNGSIDVTGAGVKTLSFTLPDSKWPSTREDGTEITKDDVETVDYPVHLVVDPSSFSAPDGPLNNERGTQPGDGQDRNYDTRDTTTGAVRGSGYRNNDWTLALVSFAPPVNVPGVLASKSLIAPRTPGATWFDPGMTKFDEATGTRSITSTSNSRLAPGTQLEARVTYYPQNEKQAPEDGTLLTLADTWDATEQHFDASRPIKLTADGTAIEPVRVEWTRTRSLADAADPDDRAGWSTSAIPTDATGVRVVYAYDADKPRTYSAVLPLVVKGDSEEPLQPWTEAPAGVWRDPLDNGRAIDDTGSGKVRAQGLLVLPRLRGMALSETVKFTGLNSKGQWVPRDGHAQPGDKATFTMTPTVTNLFLSNEEFVPTVTVTLDRFMLKPVNLTPDVWHMECTDRVGTTPAVCVFTAKEPMKAKPTDPVSGQSLQSGTLPTLSYEATISRLANGIHMASALTNTTSMTIEGIGGEASPRPAAQVAVASTEDISHDMSIDRRKIEVGEVFTVNASLVGQRGEGLDRMLVMPSGDEDLAALLRAAAVRDANDGDPEGDEEFLYEGPDFSSFRGSYRVAGIAVDPDNSTVENVNLQYAYVAVEDLKNLDAAEILDPASYDAWQEYDGGALEAPEGTLALVRITLDEEDDRGRVNAAMVSIELDTEDNRADDEYVVWGSPSTGGTDLRVQMNWPVSARVVDSSITGKVWWDENDDTKLGASEPGIAGVKVTLHPVGDDGKAGEPLAETVTTEDGTYTFDGLHSGKYVTRVHAFDADGNPLDPFSRVVDLYGSSHDPQQTYSFLNKLRSGASQESTVIDLGVDADQKNVSFGFYAAEPRVAVDKAVESLRPNGDGTYTVEWRVSATNTGNTPLDGAKITDRVDDDVIGLTAESGVPVQWKDVVVAPGYSTGAQATTYAIDHEDRLWAWGYNAYGQVGDGTTTQRHTPVLISGRFGDLGKVAQVEVASESHYGTVFVVDKDGQLWAWGRNSTGEVGNGLTAQQTVPYKVSGGNGLGTVAKGTDGRYQLAAVASSTTAVTVYAIDVDGRLWAWGSNTSGQVANGSTTTRTTPYQVTSQSGAGRITEATQVVTAGATTYAVDGSGNVWAWGSNASGQVGNGASATNVLAPFNVSARTPALSGVSTLAVTANPGTTTTVYAIDRSGDLWGWGENASLQVEAGGADVTTPRKISSPTGLGAVSKVVTGGTGTSTTAYAVDTQGNLWAWGENGSRQVGNNATTDVGVPFKLSGLGAVSEVVASGSSTGVTAYAVRADGTLHSWGYNSNGETGTGSTGVVGTPTPVAGIGQVRTVVSSSNVAYAIGASGWLWAWGMNNYRQVGVEETADQPTPVRLSDLGQVRSVATNSRSTLALTTSGDLWGWGGNAEGAAGHPTAYVPTPQPVLPAVREVVTTGDVTAAVDMSGNVWAWGDNTHRATAKSTSGNTTRPFLVTDGTPGRPVAPVKSLHASGYYNFDTLFAVDANGELWSWGFVGMAGAGVPDGNILIYNSWKAPTKLSTGAPGELGTVKKVFARHEQSAANISTVDQADGVSYAIDDDGSLWTWGSGAASAFGTSTGVQTSCSYGLFSPIWRAPACALSPVNVTGLTDVVDVAMSSDPDRRTTTTFAVEADGDLWAWGANTSGQVGNGTTTEQPSPVKITGLGAGTDKLEAVEKVFTKRSTANRTTVYALEKDGELWAWGANNNGQVGNGGSVNATAPVKITGRGTGSEKLGTVRDVVPTGPSVLVIDTQDRVWSWGADVTGHLGNGTAGNTNVPSLVTGVDDVRQVVAADATQANVNCDLSPALSGCSVTAYAIDADGHLWSWGGDAQGAVGDGGEAATVDRPVDLTAADNGLGTVRKVVAAATQHGATVFAVDAGGSVWSWGSNRFGSVGDGTAGDRHTPYKNTVLRGVADVVVGTGYDTLVAYAIGESGQLWAWGSNTFGQVGNGTESLATPTALQRIVGNPALVTPVSENAGNGYRELTYNVPDLRPGERRDFTITGTVRQPVAEAGPLCVINQAWFDSGQTPITGLLDAPDTAPAWSGGDLDGCSQEKVDGFNVHAQQQQVDALMGKAGSDSKWNSFDEVASLIPALAPEQSADLGSVSGVVWHDANGNGLRDEESPSAGVEVTLYAGDDVFDATVTDASGAYQFDDVPAGERYRVVFGPPSLQDGQYHAWTQQDVGEDDSIDSDVARSTSSAGPLTVVAGEHTTADAGYVVHGPVLDARAGIEDGARDPLTGPTGECRFDADGTVSEPCDPMLLSATQAGGTKAARFAVVVDNTGNEALGDLELRFTGSHAVTDATLVLTTGDDTVSFTLSDGVYTAPSGFELKPGATLTGWATLEAGIQPGVKVDLELTASGQGVSSRAQVEDKDPWNADVNLAKLTVAKTAWRTDGASDYPVAAGGTYPEGTIKFCYVVTNTGEVPVTGIDLEDMASMEGKVDWSVFKAPTSFDLEPGDEEKFCVEPVID